jgi:hypothetical protein
MTLPLGPLEHLPNRVNVPTIPIDPNDPPRFSQLTETCKDAFQAELTAFFNYKALDFAQRKAEIPTIQKYNLGFSPSDKPIETFTRILLQHPDILEKLPLIAITAATGQHLPLGIGTQIVCATQLPARIKSSVTSGGPFALVDGDFISFQTTPNGKQTATSTVLFKRNMFVSIGAATMAEVIAVANVQMLYVTAKSTSYSTSTPLLRFDAIGPIAQSYPNYIRVVGGSTNALAVLGFTVGQQDLATNHPPSNRYQIAQNLTIGIDIGTEDENERREITDLVNYFFVLEMDKRRKTFLGRSIFDDEYFQPGNPPLQENYQVTLLDKHSLAGEAEIPRQSGSSEQQDLLYINRMNVPVTIIDYVDRRLLHPYGYLDQDTLTHAVDDNGLPAGDHVPPITGETSQL